MSFELCFRAREAAADDRRPVEGIRPLPSWVDLAPACVSLPASVQVDTIGQKVQIDDLNAGTELDYYTYNGQGQLLTSEERLVSDPSALVRRMRYDYDVLGNLVEKHTTRCVETTYPCTEQDDPTDEYYTHWFGTATYHGDQLISADGGDGNNLVATYDVAGNMETLAVTRGGQPYFTHTYTWDEQNRLASAVGTGQMFHGGQGVVAVAGYAYDNGGTRIAALRAKTFVGVELEETLYIDPSFELRNGEYTTYIHDSKGRLARLLPIDDNIISKITWLHADHLGSTSVVTSDDGTFIEETKYLPYGAVQSTYRPDLGLPYEPYGFTGKEPEPDFGILYFGARYYNPHLARWLSPDPLFLHVTSETAEKDQNLYCYASNDPVGKIDSNGEKTKNLFGITPIISIILPNRSITRKVGQYIFDNSLSDIAADIKKKTVNTAVAVKNYALDNPLEAMALVCYAGSIAIPPFALLGAGFTAASAGKDYYDGKPAEGTVKLALLLIPPAASKAWKVCRAAKVPKPGNAIPPPSPPPPLPPPPAAGGAGRFVGPKVFTNRHGQLTNGRYILDEAGMAPHTTGSLAGGKSQFLYRVNEKQLALDAAAYADDAGLWVGNKAKVVLDDFIGVHGGTGQRTQVVNIYRTDSGFIHAAPGSPL